MSRVNAWQERETVVNVSSKLRTDVERQNLQKSRGKYFSPPRRPWDFSTFSQPKRLWEISPPYRREVQRGNILSTVPSEVAREVYDDSCHETRTICGLFPDNPGIGRQRRYGNALYQESPTDAKTTAQREPSHVKQDQVKVTIHDSSPKIFPAWLEGSNPSPKQTNRDDSLPVTTALQQGHESQLREVHQEKLAPGALKAKEKGELHELESLKVQMTLLRESLGLYFIQGELGQGGSAENGFGSKEFQSLKAVGALRQVLMNELTVGADLKTIDKEVDFAHSPGNQDEERLISRFRSQAWKVGICTASQILVWYLIMIQPVIRCAKGLSFPPPT